MLDKNQLSEIFEYKNGFLYWKKKTSTKCSNIKIGDIAGTVRPDGYSAVKLNYKLYLTHRIIFMMFNGYLPKIVDHIDGNPKNNKIENLREVTRSQNCQNQKIRRNNTSGVKCVTLDKSRNKWLVQIHFNKKKKNLGYYQDLELAELVAIEARDKYHGGFARHL
jgi:HNH endonuclease/AP2 domain